jgi:hypothetical protein
VRKISLLGAISGGVIDIVLSGLAGVPLIAYVIATSNLRGLPPDQVSRTLIRTIHDRPAVYAAQLVIGFLCTVAGAYIGALIAKRAEILNGVLSSFVCLMFGIYGMVSGMDISTPLARVGLFLLTVTAGFLGGYLRSRQVRKRQAVTAGA